MAFTLQTRKTDTLLSTMAAGASSCTLTAGAFGTPTGQQIITVDYDVPAKAADFLCTLAGTAVTSMALLNGPDVAHSAGANVAMTFVDEHYDRVANRTLGYASATANQGTFTAETDLTGLSVTVTVPTGGARIRITAKAALNSSVNGDAVVMYVKEGATYLQQWTGTATANNVDYTCQVSFVTVATAGSHTYKVSAARSAGTGNVTSKAAATIPAFILVENIE